MDFNIDARPFLENTESTKAKGNAKFPVGKKGKKKDKRKRKTRGNRAIRIIGYTGTCQKVF